MMTSEGPVPVLMPGSSPVAAEESAGPEPAITLRIFAGLPGGSDGQRLAIQAVHEAFREFIQGAAEERHAVLTAILDELDEAGRERERRRAAASTLQREIIALGDRELESQAAERLVIDDTLWVFSDQPLSDLHEGAVNVPTPHLTPYDIFDEEGNLRSESPGGDVQ